MWRLSLSPTHLHFFLVTEMLLSPWFRWSVECCLWKHPLQYDANTTTKENTHVYKPFIKEAFYKGTEHTNTFTHYEAQITREVQRNTLWLTNGLADRWRVAESDAKTDWTLGHLRFGQLQQAEGTRRSPGARLRSMGAGTTSRGGCWAGRGEGRRGEGRWGWRGAGVHEALWCHRNVSPCQVQSSLAVIFWAIRVLILRTLASWQTRRLAEGVPHSYTEHTHTHTYWNTHTQTQSHRATHTDGQSLNNSQESTLFCTLVQFLQSLVGCRDPAESDWRYETMMYVKKWKETQKTKYYKINTLVEIKKGDMQRENNTKINMRINKVKDGYM